MRKQIKIYLSKEGLELVKKGSYPVQLAAHLNRKGAKDKTKKGE